MEIDKKQVKIPRQIRLKTEFFIGFGMEELIKTLIVGAIASVIGFIFYKITGKTIIATMLVIGSVIISTISLVKGNNNFSMVDTINNIVKYELMQKEYRYKSNKYENIKGCSFLMGKRSDKNKYIKKGKNTEP